MAQSARARSCLARDVQHRSDFKRFVCETDECLVIEPSGDGSLLDVFPDAEYGLCHRSESRTTAYW